MKLHDTARAWIYHSNKVLHYITLTSLLILCSVEVTFSLCLTTAKLVTIITPKRDALKRLKNLLNYCGSISHSGAWKPLLTGKFHFRWIDMNLLLERRKFSHSHQISHKQHRSSDWHLSVVENNKFSINFQFMQYVYFIKDWGCVILREIDFLLKICRSIPCLHSSWKVHTWIEICASLNHRKKTKADSSRLWFLESIQKHKCF